MKTLLYITGLAALLSVAAQASTVTYNTSGSELCIGASGCGVLTQTVGSVSITFNPITSSSVMAEPTTFGSFGELVLSCVNGGTACGSQSLNGLNLFINVAQSAPSAGNGSIPSGVIAGTVSGTASNASIT